MLWGKNFRVNPIQFRKVYSEPEIAMAEENSVTSVVRAPMIPQLRLIASSDRNMTELPGSDYISLGNNIPWVSRWVSTRHHLHEYQGHF